MEVVLANKNFNLATQRLSPYGPLKSFITQIAKNASSSPALPYLWLLLVILHIFFSTCAVLKIGECFSPTGWKKKCALQVPPVVPYIALGEIRNALYGT